MSTFTRWSSSLHARVALLVLASLSACAETPTVPTDGLASAGQASAVRQGVAGGDGVYVFTTIDVPGALSTTVSGISPSGDIVGWFDDLAGSTHGFLLKHHSESGHAGSFTTIDYPGSARTQARGIAPNGEIVGTYRRVGEPAVNAHGFRLTREGEFVAADYPGYTNTIAQRILPNGTILGCRHENDVMASMRGVAMSRHSNEEIAEFASMHNGATPDLRRITGLYMDMLTGEQRGFLIHDGVFTPLMVPGSKGTAAWDMNPKGDIVGAYENSAGFHGFLLSGRGYHTIDVPGATLTRAFGINRTGSIVGAFTQAGRTHGFVAMR